MKRILAVACAIALASIPVAGKTKAMVKAEKGHAMSDQQFVELAGQTDMVEANLGQLAQTAAESQQVKDFGQTLAADHTSDYQQLAQAASQANLTMPGSIDKEHNKMMIDPFQKLKGAAFDHKYILEMIAGHMKAIEVYKKEAEHAENPALKSYAQAALPTLEKHLAAAKELARAKK